MWINFAPLRETDITGSLGDIEGHLPRDHIYRDEDKVTWAHESTHGVNSAIRNEWKKPNWNAAYILENRAFLLEEPDIPLSAIARATPQELKGDVFQLYLIDQQRYWNEQPLYILDELSAYHNGTVVAVEVGVDQTRLVTTLNHAIEFLGYACVLHELVGSAELTDFLTTMTMRLRELVIPEVQARWDTVQRFLPEDIP